MRSNPQLLDSNIVERSALPKRPILWLNTAFLTVFPLTAICAAIWYGFTYGITWRELVGASFCWVVTGLGVTAGYHRLFSHKGYKAHPAVRFVLAMLGAAAGQNSAIAWCSDHRYHHSDTDTDGDPYDATRGFWYSHMGWIFFRGLRGDAYDNVPDLKKDRVLAFQHRYWLPLAFGVNFVLIGLCALVLGRLLGMFIIAGMLRLVIVQHFTFCINSLAHIWGKQPYSQKTTSKDNWALSLVTWGEGYHNYHHSFEWDYRNGPRWFNWDPTKWLIWSLARVGLASNLRRTPMDVVLQTRFEEGRRGFLDRIGSWSELKRDEWAHLIETKREQLRTQRDDFIAGIRQSRMALHDQLVASEAALEVDLQELKAMRQALADRIRHISRETSEEIRSAMQREIRHLRRSVRNAQRSAKAALRSWEKLAGEYVFASGLRSVPSAA